MYTYSNRNIFIGLHNTPNSVTAHHIMYFSISEHDELVVENYYSFIVAIQTTTYDCYSAQLYWTVGQCGAGADTGFWKGGGDPASC